MASSNPADGIGRSVNSAIAYKIRTVRGDIEPASAGIVDSHDHLFLATPLIPGGELVDERAAESELRDFAVQGGGMLVQWTPRGLQRNLAGLRRISAATGIHVVAATGRHREAVYGADSTEVRRTVDQLVDVFVADVLIRGCGLIKVGVSRDRIEGREYDALHAAAAAHRVTGVPIAIHLEQGSAADAVLNALFADGVSAESIVLGHLGRNHDPRRVLEAAQSGAWLCFDGPSDAHQVSAERLAALMGTLVQEGHVGQLLFGADRTSARAGATGGNGEGSGSGGSSGQPGPAAFIAHTAARLGDELGAVTLDRILRGNPAAAWQRRIGDR